jgi:hypothetical protein
MSLTGFIAVQTEMQDDSADLVAVTDSTMTVPEASSMTVPSSPATTAVAANVAIAVLPAALSDTTVAEGDTSAVDIIADSANDRDSLDQYIDVHIKLADISCLVCWERFSSAYV